MTQGAISRSVLFVDDDENLLNGIRRQLRGHYDVTTACGPTEALEVVGSKTPFAAVFSDFNMPGMNGVEFLRQVHVRTPDTVRVMLTGRGEMNLVITALHEGQIFRFLNKPVERDTLYRTLDDALEQYRLITAEHRLTAELNSANESLQTLNEQLEQRVAERTATIRALHQFVSELNGLDSLNDVAKLVVRTASEMLASSRVSLMMPDKAGEYLQMVAAVGVPSDVLERVRIPVGVPIAGFVFSEAREIVVNHLTGPAQDAAVADSGGSSGRYEDEVYASWPLACASLVTKTRPVGVLNITGHDGPYDQESLAQLKAIAEAATIALVNQIRREERNEARDATILALAKLAEHRDPETGAHLERVQGYCRLLSTALAETSKYSAIIDREFIDEIVRSSPLHDIGKVGIPDRILLKPGRFEPEEFEIMKRHAVIGGDTLRGLVDGGRRQRFLHMGMEIAYYHHEKFNGTGYPKGLSGEEIPLPARILALADVYDALSSKRVYKDAMPHEKVIQIIREETGKHFDPDIVEAFFRHEDEFRRLAQEMSESGPTHVPEPASPTLVQAG